MMAAITAASHGHNVTLLERNDRLGKKLYITGGGRCNLTYATDPEGLIQNVVGNPSFMYSSFYSFGSEDIIKFFENRSVPLKIEEGRVFPKSGKSQDIIDALQCALKEFGVQVRLNCRVTDIRQFLDNGGKVIVATGGLSYPATGSTGDGYRWAKELGHTVTGLHPALVPLHVEKVPDLAGLSLQDVRLSAVLSGKKLFESIGELIFTHSGISGPLALTASRYLAEHIGNGPTVSIDLMPHFDLDQLDKHLLYAFESYPNKSLGNIMAGMLPKRIAMAFGQKNKNTKANSVTKGERTALARSIKNMSFDITGTAGFREAVITVGGIDVREINPGDMSSKKIPGLYFAGEVLDVDALTGGFNLQIAFSTGYMAGQATGQATGQAIGHPL